MRKNLAICIFLFSCIDLFAQTKADSLLALLAKVQESEKSTILNQLSAYYQENDSARSMSYARQALALAQKSGNEKESCNAWFNMAECLYCCEEFHRAMDLYQKALTIARATGDKIQMCEILNAMALVHYFKSEYDQAIEHQMEALRCVEKTEAKDLQARVYSNMGMVHSRVGDYRKSINYYRKAVELNEQIGLPEHAAINYNGIGVVYYSMDKPDSSKINYEIALKGFRKANDRKNVAITLNNIANVLVTKGDSLEKALDYFRQALEVFEELKDIRNSTFVIESLGAAYVTMGNPEKGLEILQSGLELAKKNKIGYYIQQSYYNDMTTAYEKMGKIREAYAAYKLHRLYLDSLHQEERIRQVNELEKKFETEKKEEEILRLHAEREVVHLQRQRERTVLVFISVVLLLTIGLTIFVLYAYLAKKKINNLLSMKNEQIEQQRNQLEKANATKNKFFSILAHDLKNPFHTIMGYSSLLEYDYERFSDEERRRFAGDINRSANNIFRLLQNLLEWSRSQTGNISYNPKVFDPRELTASVFGLMAPLAEKKSISLENSVPQAIQVYADPMMIETVVRNLLSNAVKFSHKGGHVTVEASRDDQGKSVTIRVIDQGEGLSGEDLKLLFMIDSKVRRKGTAGEEGSGLGLALCREFVQINKGTIQAEGKPGEGCTFSITLPAKS